MRSKALAGPAHGGEQQLLASTVRILVQELTHRVQGQQLAFVRCFVIDWLRHSSAREIQGLSTDLCLWSGSGATRERCSIAPPEADAHNMRSKSLSGSPIVAKAIIGARSTNKGVRVTDERTGGWRTRHALLGVLMTCCAYLLGVGMGSARVHMLPVWAKFLYASAVLCGGMLAIFFLGSALGLISSELLASAGEGRAPSAKVWISVYIGSLVLLGLFSLIAISELHTDPIRAAIAECGIFLLVASTGRPWWWFGTIRRLGWFAFIKSDHVMRWLLAAIGLVSLAVGVFGNIISIAS